jgi:hypothetical protein
MQNKPQRHRGTEAQRHRESQDAAAKEFYQEQGTKPEKPRGESALLNKSLQVRRNRITYNHDNG